MTRTYFFLFLAAIFATSSFSHSVARAETDLGVDLNFYGELDLTTSIYFLPTGQRGNTAFRMPQLKLGTEMLLKNGNSVELLFEGAEKRDGTSGRFDVQVKEAYLDLVSPFRSMRSLRYGLVPNSWQENQRETWNFDYMGSLGKSFTEKNSYISYSDLGLMYLSELPYDSGSWTFSATNGEGLESDEIGPRKEVQLFLNWTRTAPIFISLGYVYGAYDLYEAALGRKDRILAQIIFEDENNFMAGLEFMDAHDPADTFAPLKMAQGVDVVAHSGENIHGQGGSIFAKLHVGAYSQLLLRYEILQVIAGDKDKQMQTAWTGLNYQLDDDIELTGAYFYVAQPEKYGVGTRDQSIFQVATRIAF